MHIKINKFTVKALPSTPNPENEIVRPFMRWAGGKQKLLGSLIDHLPPMAQIKSYVEPFLGAGSLFLACGFPNAILNDLNAHLINAYQIVRDHPIPLHHLLLLHLANYELRGKKYYYEVREDYNEHLQNTDISQAARFIFLIHSNFKGIFRVNLKGRYNVPCGNNRPRILSLDELTKISKRLQGATFFNKSFEEIPFKIDKGTFVYLDPPYPPLSPTANFTNYTMEGFSEEDHYKLATYARTLSEGGAKVMISISNAPFVKQLYGIGWHYHAAAFKRTLNAKKSPLEVKEIILTNYKVNKKP